MPDPLNLERRRSTTWTCHRWTWYRMAGKQTSALSTEPHWKLRTRLRALMMIVVLPAGGDQAFDCWA